MCLRFVFLLITRLAAWLRLSRREEAWKTAEILILRHQLAVLQSGPAAAPRCRRRSRTDSGRSRGQLSSAVVQRSSPGPPGTSVPAAVSYMASHGSPASAGVPMRRTTWPARKARTPSIRCPTARPAARAAVIRRPRATSPRAARMSPGTARCRSASRSPSGCRSGHGEPAGT